MRSIGKVDLIYFLLLRYDQIVVVNSRRLVCYY